MTPGHHTILGLPLFENRFVQVGAESLSPCGCTEGTAGHQINTATGAAVGGELEFRPAGRRRPLVMPVLASTWFGPSLLSDPAQVNNLTGAASFSGLLDPPGCTTLDLLGSPTQAPASAPAVPDSIPFPAVAPSPLGVPSRPGALPPLATPPSAAGRPGAKPALVALAAGLPLMWLAALSWATHAIFILSDAR